MGDIKEIIYHTAETVIGKHRGTKKERWITEHTWKSIIKWRMLKGKKEQMASTGEDIAKITEEYRQKDKEVKKNCKKDKQQWINQKGSEEGEAAEVSNTKVLYQIVKELAGSNTRASRPPIKQKYGKYVTTCHDEQIIRWKEHFSSVLNCPEPEMLHDFEDDIKQQDIPTLDMTEGPMTEEVIRAIKHLKNGKAAGTYGIQPELLKHADEPVQYRLAEQRGTNTVKKWYNCASP